MKTIAHKEAVATHPVSSITIDTTVNHGDTSIGQAIAQALADGSKPSAEQSAADSHLPKIDIPGFGRDAPSLTDHSPGDSPKGDGRGFSLDSISLDAFKTPVAAMGDTLLASLHKDPQRDTPDDWLPGSHPSSADLRADVGITHGSSDAGAHNQAAAATLIEHSQASREKAEGMLGKYLGNDGFVGPDELRSDGKWHNTAMDASDQGITVMRDYVRTDNGGIKLASTTVIDSNNHTATTVRDDGSTVTSKDGKVVDTTDPLELPSSTPDADRPTTLPSLGDLLKDLDQAHHPSHDGTTSNVAGDDIPGTVSAVNVSGQFVEHPRHDGPADPGNPASGIGDEGRPNGSPGEVGPGASGNLINDLNQTSQSSGPEERNAQPQIKTDPTGHSSGGQQGNGSDQNGTGSHQVTLTARPNETPAQHLAQELRDAVDSTHAGEPTKAAQSVEAAHAGHDIASALASTPGGHDNGAFADLLRLAQNPAQSGLVPPPIAAAHDAIAALQLSALGDLAGHAGDVHRVDDFHATALALPVAAHADVTHVTAAVVDHHGHH